MVLHHNILWLFQLLIWNSVLMNQISSPCPTNLWSISPPVCTHVGLCIILTLPWWNICSTIVIENCPSFLTQPSFCASTYICSRNIYHIYLYLCKFVSSSCIPKCFPSEFVHISLCNDEAILIFFHILNSPNNAECLYPDYYLRYMTFLFEYLIIIKPMFRKWQHRAEWWKAVVRKHKIHFSWIQINCYISEYSSMITFLIFFLNVAGSATWLNSLSVFYCWQTQASVWYFSCIIWLQYI